jgi:hypothetical protein
VLFHKESLQEKETMQGSFPERYPNWREVYAALTQPPQHRSTTAVTDELLAEHLQLLAGECLQTVQARDRFFIILKAYVAQPGRTPEHQALVEDWAAVALKTFSQGSSQLLELSIMRLMRLQREALRQPPIIHAPQPQAVPPQSLLQRLLGS